eukprot:scaffold6733_cov100-Isochrysis_galbana.AAC.2
MGRPAVAHGQVREGGGRGEKGDGERREMGREGRWGESTGRAHAVGQPNRRQRRAKGRGLVHRHPRQRGT